MVRLAGVGSSSVASVGGLLASVVGSAAIDGRSWSGVTDDTHGAA